MNEQVPAVSARSRSGIESFAQWLVREVSPKTLRAAKPFPIARFCEFALEELTGIGFAVSNLPAGTEGKLEGNELIIDEAVYEGANRNLGRPRFTLAHELGHCLLHAEQLQRINTEPSRVVLYRRADLKAYNDPEWQANVFAGALLMPTAAMVHIVAECGANADDLTIVEQAAELLSVSPAAVQVRLRALRAKGLLPTNQPVTQNGFF